MTRLDAEDDEEDDLGAAAAPGGSSCFGGKGEQRRSDMAPRAPGGRCDRSPAQGGSAAQRGLPIHRPLSSVFGRRPHRRAGEPRLAPALTFTRIRLFGPKHASLCDMTAGAMLHAYHECSHQKPRLWRGAEAADVGAATYLPLLGTHTPGNSSFRDLFPEIRLGGARTGTIQSL